jgi:hypothetical protein
MNSIICGFRGAHESSDGAQIVYNVSSQLLGNMNYVNCQTGHWHIHFSQLLYYFNHLSSTSISCMLVY